MSILSSLLPLLASIAAGFACWRLGLFRSTDRVSTVFSAALYLLLLSMGLRLGQSRDVISSIPLVGAIALVGTVGPCAGTVILHILMAPVYRRLERSPRGKNASPRDEPREAQRDNPRDAASARAPVNERVPGSGTRRLARFLLSVRKPLFLLALVVAGTLAGLALPEIPLLAQGTVGTWILYFLLFVIGIQLAGSGTGLGALALRPSLVLVPAVTVVGSLAGSLLSLPFGGMTPGKALALGSGFGWYSLSGVLISDLGDPLLGTASFLANLLRESVSFLAIPLLARTGRCESGIGIAGATSMDVTLPLVKDTWGTSIVPLSVAHGVIMSFLVPFFVPLFMSF